MGWQESLTPEMFGLRQGSPCGCHQPMLAEKPVWTHQNKLITVVPAAWYCTAFSTYQALTVCELWGRPSAGHSYEGGECCRQAAPSLVQKTHSKSPSHLSSLSAPTLPE